MEQLLRIVVHILGYIAMVRLVVLSPVGYGRNAGIHPKPDTKVDYRQDHRVI